jgi:hypothetical protein
VRALLLLLVLGGCTIEPRWEVEPEEPSPDTVALPESASPEEAVATTVEVFREAVRVGDLSLALSLLDRDAILADDLADGNGEGTTRGEVLMELRRRHAAGLRLEAIESQTREVAGGWLVSTRLDILGTDEEGEPTLDGHARESALLAPTDEGWRIVLFHRSRIP